MEQAEEVEAKEILERHGDPEAEEVQAGEEEEEEEATCIHLLRQGRTRRHHAWRLTEQPLPPLPPSRLLRLRLQQRLPLHRRLLRLPRNEEAGTLGGGLELELLQMVPVLHTWYNPREGPSLKRGDRV